MQEIAILFCVPCVARPLGLCEGPLFCKLLQACTGGAAGLRSTGHKEEGNAQPKRQDAPQSSEVQDGKIAKNFDRSARRGSIGLKETKDRHLGSDLHLNRCAKLQMKLLPLTMQNIPPGNHQSPCALLFIGATVAKCAGTGDSQRPPDLRES